MGDVLGPESATACTWEFKPVMCPPHLLKTCLGAGTLNCTLLKDSHECGGPFKTVSFIAEGWFINLYARSCDASYDPVVADSQRAVPTRFASSSSSNATDGLVSGNAWIFEGRIHNMFTKDGFYLPETKGDVSFVVQFQADAPTGNSTGVQVDHQYGGNVLPVVVGGSLKIDLFNKKY